MQILGFIVNDSPVNIILNTKIVLICNENENYVKIMLINSQIII